MWKLKSLSKWTSSSNIAVNSRKQCRKQDVDMSYRLDWIVPFEVDCPKLSSSQNAIIYKYCSEIENTKYWGFEHRRHVFLVTGSRMRICDMIKKRNESDVGNIVFEILTRTVFKFLCFILFLALSNPSYLCNQIHNCNGVCIKMKHF